MNEAAFWRQRYEILMANFNNIVILADKNSYELGKLHGERDEREACAKVADYYASGLDRNYSEIIADAIRARGEQA